MTNLGFFTYKHGNAVNFYRCIGPLKELHRTEKDITTNEIQYAAWFDLAGLDGVFFNKPYATDIKNEDGTITDHEKAIKIIKSNNKPLILDYDDLLCEVPEETNFHRINMDTPYKENFKKFINEADGVIFSTQYMAQYLIDNGILKHDNYKVINNAINDHTLKFDYSFSEFNKTILWRGTSTHFPDFENYIEQLINVIQNNLDFTFVFMGVCPDKRLKDLPNARFRPPTDVIAYHHYIKTIKPSLVFVPLKDIPFNRAKSNCSKLEATFAGAITMSPDFEEFNFNDKSDLSHFNTENFGQKLEQVIDLIRKKSPFISDLYRYNYNYVRANYLLKDKNIQRAKFINSIVKYGGTKVI